MDGWMGKKDDGVWSRNPWSRGVVMESGGFFFSFGHLCGVV